MDDIGCIIGCRIKSDTIKITPEILALIAELDEFKGAWRALGTLAPERLSALRRVRHHRKYRFLNPHRRGSKLSDREVERLLANLDIKSFATRDEQEVAGYAEAMEIDFPVHGKNIPVTEENHIKQFLHRDLLIYSEKRRPASRQLQDFIQQRRRFR